jgi:Cys-tRNA(Pro)/Cys-tRNA(Cys) deacylase
MRKLELIPLAELTPLTGYVRGGCSPLGMRKAYPTWLDETCGLFGTILVSAGQRGLQIELAPDDLLALCLQGGCPGARCADISHAV